MLGMFPSAPEVATTPPSSIYCSFISSTGQVSLRIVGVLVVFVELYELVCPGSHGPLYKAVVLAVASAIIETI